VRARETFFLVFIFFCLNGFCFCFEKNRVGGLDSTCDEQQGERLAATRVTFGVVGTLPNFHLPYL